MRFIHIGMHEQYTTFFKESRQKSIAAVRYVNLDCLSAFYKKLNATIKVIGHSVENRPIHLMTLGQGPAKIFMWSQMHGNESTTTKAVLDLLLFLSNADREFTETTLTNCTLYIIPMLNPDGAERYTRENANGIDLNRDALALTQPESVVLRKAFERIKPEFCFNLHDQRTLYSVGENPVSATVSFLSPAQDDQRTITPNRKTAMQLIVAMKHCLEQWIPGQISRYDDTYNNQCVGDTFQAKGIPTILFEAGHFPGDYQRERTRELIFYALLECLKVISVNTITSCKADRYFEIPESKKLFFDILIKNVRDHEDIGVLFEEKLSENRIIFLPKIEKKGALAATYFGHQCFDLNDNSDLKHLKMNPKLYEILNNY